jgi:hypothetical protein
MTHPLKQWPIMPTDTLNVALKPPSRVLDPHRRTLFTQRLAVLIQRLRVVGASPKMEQVADEDEHPESLQDHRHSPRQTSLCVCPAILA